MSSEVLRRIGNSAGPKLIESLEHLNTQGLKEVIGILQAIYYQPAVESMIRLSKHPHIGVRVAAVDALGTFEDIRTESPLLSALKDDEASVRGAAVTALGEKNGPDVSNSIIGMLNDSDASVRLSAVEAIGERKETAAIPDLIQLYRNDDLAHLREVCISVLSSLGKDDRIVETCILALKDPDTDVRIAAGGYLGKRYFIENPDPGGFAFLLEELKNKSYWTRGSVRNTISEIGEPMVPYLIDLLGSFTGDDDYDQWSSTYEILADIGKPAVPQLIEALGSEKYRQREGASRALESIGPDALDLLVDRLNHHKNSAVRKSIVFIIEDIGGPEAIAALEKALQDASPEVSDYSRSALIDLGAYRGTIQPLIDIISSKSVEESRKKMR